MSQPIELDEESVRYIQLTMMFIRVSRAASRSFWITTERDEIPLFIGIEATTTARPAKADQPRSCGREGVESQRANDKAISSGGYRTEYKNVQQTMSSNGDA